MDHLSIPVYQAEYLCRKMYSLETRHVLLLHIACFYTTVKESRTVFFWVFFNPYHEELYQCLYPCLVQTLMQTVDVRLLGTLFTHLTCKFVPDFKRLYCFMQNPSQLFCFTHIFCCKKSY